MNREQARKYHKALRADGKTKEEADQIVRVRKELDKLKQTFKYFNEGDKVKLNIESIKSDVDYKRKTEKWKKFVDDNADEVFTIEYDKKRKDTTFVCLEEDTTDPKWLWWENDLMLVEE